MVMGCASAKASHVTTTVAPVVEVSQGIQSENTIVNGLEPPPVIIEGERPPNLVEETVASLTKGACSAELTTRFSHFGNEAITDVTNAMKEVQLVAPAPDINGSTVSVTLTPDEVDENELKELLEERTPVKVVIKKTTDWMKQVTTSTAEEFQRIAQSTSENPSEILHMANYEPNSPTSSDSSSSSEDELEAMSLDQKLEVDSKKLAKVED